MGLPNSLIERINDGVVKALMSRGIVQLGVGFGTKEKPTEIRIAILHPSQGTVVRNKDGVEYLQVRLLKDLGERKDVAEEGQRPGVPG